MKSARIPLSLLMLTALCASALSAQTAPGTGGTAAEEAARKALVADALRYQGVPYVYGAESPAAFDCSGFVRYVYAETLGITLPRSAREQWAAGRSVPLAEAQGGDVIVFDTVGGAPSHVGLILDGESFIHAASAGAKTGVIVSKLSERYFAPKILGTRVYIIRPAERQEPPKAAAPEKPLARAEVEKNLASKELVVSTVGFTITDELSIVSDRIPAKTGTAIQFAVTNGTGRDGVFEILFYKMDLDPAKVQTLRKDRVSLKAGGFVEVAPFTFTGSGQYKLILKTHDNMKRVERTWKVVDIK